MNTIENVIFVYLGLIIMYSVVRISINGYWKRLNDPSIFRTHRKVVHAIDTSFVIIIFGSVVYIAMFMPAS